MRIRITALDGARKQSAVRKLGLSLWRGREINATRDSFRKSVPDPPITSCTSAVN